MSSLPEPISALISALNRLPGVGPRSAERIALHLSQAEAESVRQLARAILTARERIQTCQTCGALTDVQPCAICSHPRRDGSLICLVEQPVDIISIEKSGTYRGKDLVDFDYGIAGRRIAARGRVSAEAVQELIDHSPLLFRFETGQVSQEQFFAEVRAATGFRGTIEEFSEFFADIFTTIEPMVKLNAELRQRGVPTYIFSNTNEL